MEAYLLFALYQVEKLALLCILQNDEDVAAGVNELKVLDDVRMIEAAQHFNFSLHLFEYSLQLDLSLVQNFDCHFVIRCFMHGHYR